MTAEVCALCLVRLRALACPNCGDVEHNEHAMGVEIHALKVHGESEGFWSKLKFVAKDLGAGALAGLSENPNGGGQFTDRGAQDSGLGELGVTPCFVGEDQDK